MTIDERKNLFVTIANAYVKIYQWESNLTAAIAPFGFNFEPPYGNATAVRQLEYLLYDLAQDDTGKVLDQIIDYAAEPDLYPAPASIWESIEDKFE